MSTSTAMKSSLIEDNTQSPPRKINPKWKIVDTPQDSSFVPTFAVTLWLGWNGIVFGLIILAIALPINVYKGIVISILLTSILLPRDFPSAYSEGWGNWIMQKARMYFGLKTTIEDNDAINEYSEKNKAVIFACEPHDILPYSVFSFNPSLNVLPGKVGADGCVLMTSAIFNIPIMKHVYSWIGGDSVDKKTFRTRLQNNQSLAFCPGGVQEVLFMDPSKPDELILYLQSRKGFIKLALENGSPIVPVFTFNLDGSYGYILPRGKLVNDLARAIGFLPVFFWGRFYVPLGIPFAQKISVVFGKPIDVPKLEIKDITEDVVNKYHTLFLDELTALFERHKHDEGYGHRTLNIM